MTPTRSRSLALLALLLTLPVLAGPLLGQAASFDSAAIHDLGRQFSAAYVRGDVAAMVELYTADAVLFPERSDAISGTSGITKYWTLPSGRRVTRHSTTPTRITVDGDHAYDYGTYEIAGERDGTPWGPIRGKYVIVWRRENDTWRIQLDIWNSGPRAEP
jgi:ketosteroid isomerase-like protein